MKEFCWFFLCNKKTENTTPLDPQQQIKFCSGKKKKL